MKTREEIESRLAELEKQREAVEVEYRTAPFSEKGYIGIMIAMIQIEKEITVLKWALNKQG